MYFYRPTANNNGKKRGDDMALKHIGKQTAALTSPPSFAGHAAVAGTKESEGPLGDSFDFVSDDALFGCDTWEQAESAMVKKTLAIALDKARCAPSEIDYLFAGDLLDQCVGTTFGLRETGIPFFGVYGACSTMAESLALAAMLIDGGFASRTAAVTSSHFCSAERQFRMPLEYGGQRTPTAQWTATASGAAVLADTGEGPYITHVTAGRIVDAGIKDAANMGAAMAPAAYDTLKTHFEDTGRDPDWYDLVVTGDLGAVGSEILEDLFRQDGAALSHHRDCGVMLYDPQQQDVHAGGSGAGCSASVLCGHLLNGMRAGRWRRILFAATGALLSPTTTLQGESIPAICCAVSITV